MSDFNDTSSLIARLVFGEKSPPGQALGADQIMALIPRSPLDFHAKRFSETLVFPGGIPATVEVFHDRANGLFAAAVSTGQGPTRQITELRAHQVTDFLYRVDKMTLENRSIDVTSKPQVQSAVDTLAGYLQAAWPRPGRASILFVRPYAGDGIPGAPAPDAGRHPGR